MNSTRSRHFSVYVISLDSIVLGDHRFSEANPGYQAGKPCVYVGMTGRTPDERFAQHKIGYKACKYPRKYGQYLCRKLFERLNPMSYEEACREEVALAERLRANGYAVWQK